MARSILIAIFILLSSTFAEAQVSPAEVQKWLDAHQPDGSGPGQVVARVDGKLWSYGTRPDAAILYTFQIGESRDRSHRQYLVVFKSVGSQYEATKPRLVGVSGLQLLNEISIADMTITLRGKTWAPGDPLCCPSEAVSVQYVVNDDELIARGLRIK